MKSTAKYEVNEMDKLIGSRLAELRKNRGLKQREVEAALNLPLRSLTRYENGKVTFNTHDLKMFADFYEVEAISLLIKLPEADLSYIRNSALCQLIEDLPEEDQILIAVEAIRKWEICHGALTQEKSDLAKRLSYYLELKKRLM